MNDASSDFRRTAAVLTGAGALPFIGLTLGMAVLDPPTDSTARLWLMVYASVILSFLGGIRWGLALAGPPPSPLPLVLSVLPALAGWVIVPYAILIQPVPGPAWFLAYAGLFALQLGWDLSSGVVPAWFKPVRLWVSLIVIACMAAAFAIAQFAG